MKQACFSCGATVQLVLSIIRGKEDEPYIPLSGGLAEPPQLTDSQKITLLLAQVRWWVQQVLCLHPIKTNYIF
jgi:hypothetical protein